MYRKQAMEEAYQEAGIWGTQPLDGLLRRWAEAQPDHPALRDSPNRRDWTSGEPRNLTYAELEHEVARVAGLFATLDLKPDSVLAMQMPNTADAVIGCLAAFRAGLTVSLLPAYWRGADMIPALAECGAKALMTVDRIEDEAVGMRLRDVAAEAFNIRYLFGFGDDLPEGMIDLPALAREPGMNPQPAPPPRKDNPANHIAVLTWAMARDGKPIAVPRSHNHLVAAGLGQTIDGVMGPHTDIISTISLSGFRGLASTLAPWLISGGTLTCHHFCKLADLIEQSTSEGPDLVVMPGTLAGSFVKGLAQKTTKLPRISAIWTCDTSDGVLPHPFPAPVTDMLFLGEAGVITSQRKPDSTRPDGLPVGLRNRPPPGSRPELVEVSFGEFDLDTKLHESQSPRQLFAKGPMVPQYTWRDYRSNGTARSQMTQMYYGMPTGLYGLVDADTGTVPLPLQTAPSSASVAGQMLPLKDLDKLYRGSPQVDDAAAFFVPDRRIGERLIAAVVPKADIPFRPADFHAFLSKQKIASHKHPHTVVEVPTIPRAENGGVVRSELLEVAKRSHAEARRKTTAETAE